MLRAAFFRSHRLSFALVGDQNTLPPCSRYLPLLFTHVCGAGTYFDTNAAIPYAGRSSVISPNGAAMPLPDGLSGEGGAMFVEASTVVVVNSIFEVS